MKEAESAEPSPAPTKPKHPNQYTYRPKPSGGSSVAISSSTAGPVLTPARRGGQGGTPAPSIAGPALHDHGTRRAGALASGAREAPFVAVQLDNLGWYLPEHLSPYASLLPSPLPLPLSVRSPRQLATLAKSHFINQKYGPFNADRDAAGKLILNVEGPEREALGEKGERHTEPPARVRFPAKRITGQEMRKRVRGMLEYVGRVQVEEGKREERRKRLGLGEIDLEGLKRAEEEKERKKVERVKDKESELDGGMRMDVDGEAEGNEPADDGAIPTGGSETNKKRPKSTATRNPNSATNLHATGNGAIEEDDDAPKKTLTGGPPVSVLLAEIMAELVEFEDRWMNGNGNGNGNSNGNGNDKGTLSSLPSGSTDSQGGAVSPVLPQAGSDQKQSSFELEGETADRDVEEGQVALTPVQGYVHTEDAVDGQVELEGEAEVADQFEAVASGDTTPKAGPGAATAPASAISTVDSPPPLSAAVPLDSQTSTDLAVSVAEQEQEQEQRDPQHIEAVDRPFAQYKETTGAQTDDPAPNDQAVEDEASQALSVGNVRDAWTANPESTNSDSTAIEKGAEPLGAIEALGDESNVGGTGTDPEPGTMMEGQAVETQHDLDRMAVLSSAPALSAPTDTITQNTDLTAESKEPIDNPSPTKSTSSSSGTGTGLKIKLRLGADAPPIVLQAGEVTDMDRDGDVEMD